LLFIFLLSLVVKLSYLAKLLRPFTLDFIYRLELSKHGLLFLAVLFSEIVREIVVLIPILVLVRCLRRMRPCCIGYLMLALLLLKTIKSSFYRMKGKVRCRVLTVRKEG